MKFLFGCFFFFSAFILFIFSGFLLLFLTIPSVDVDIISAIEPIKSKEIRDKNGELLFDFSKNTKRTIISYEEISKNTIYATIAVEDRTFYSHSGVRPLAILRSFLFNIFSSSFNQGGSTITQQLIKNLLLTSEKKLFRKLREILIAFQTEQSFTKNQIITAYLNTIPYGGVLYGVEAASLRYFGKSNIKTSIAESAYLASLPKAPTYYSPYGQNRFYLEERKNFILKQMFLLNFINKKQYIEASREVVIFKNKTDSLIQAPHFVFFVSEFLKNRPKQNKTKETIYTTLDFSLQKKLKILLEEKFAKIKKRLGAQNLSLIVLNTKSGEILSMIGSLDYFNSLEEGNVNNTLSLRQPGSSIKPFIYAAAFESGLSPESIVYDVQTQFSSTCEKENLQTTLECYSPSNFTNDFVGPITLREALSQSRNIPAVKTLYLSGNNAQRIVYKTNIGGEKFSKHGLSAALGSNEVSLLNLVNAYRIFPNNGFYSDFVWEKGRKNSQDSVISKKTANYINSILSDNITRSLVFTGLGRLLKNRPDVAVKTGTTNNTKDIWIIGYTKQYIIGVWAGNNDATPLLEGYGASLSDIWYNSLIETEKHLGMKRDSSFEKPSLYNEFKELPLVGGYIKRKNLEETESILGFITPIRNKILPIGEISDQYKNWNYGIFAWENNIETNSQYILNKEIEKNFNPNSNIFYNYFSF